MRIRPAHLNDIPEMHRIRLAVRENRLSDPSSVQRSDYVSMLTDGGRGWVAEADGRVLGFAMGRLEPPSVWALFVDPDYERRGAGRRLHDAMLAWFTEAGVKRVTLTTTPGTRAERFYVRAGWRATGVPVGGDEVQYEWRPGER